MSSADNLYKQFGPRSGPTKCRAWSGPKLFDTLMVFLKEFFEKVDFEISSRRQKSMQNYIVGKGIKYLFTYILSIVVLKMPYAYYVCCILAEIGQFKKEDVIILGHECCHFEDSERLSDVTQPFSNIFDLNNIQIRVIIFVLL